MDKELIYIGPVNNAFKAKEILKKNGYEVKIERGIGNSRNRGCGYSVLVVNGTVEEAEKILRSNGLLNKS